MRGKRSLATVAALAAALALATMAPAVASATESTTAGLGKIAAPLFAPVTPNVGNRPTMLLETDSYVYGDGTGFNTPAVTLSVDDFGYDQPATLYVYWQNRVSGQTLYYNVGAGFVATQRDLLGASAAAPAKVFVPDLDEFRLFGPNSAFGNLPGNVPSGVGRYQFVVEVRDANGSAVIARANAMYNVVAGVVGVSGTIAGGNWSADNLYVLETPVYVDGGVLAIAPGTMVFGSQAGQGTLIVLPGGRLEAAGTAMLPIVMTSELEVGTRGPGDWGGLVLSGNAPINGGPRQGEGDSGQYGGNDPSHDCGTLRYVRVEYAGIRFSTQNELNGIALQGCGTGTTVDHVQVHFNQDDGIEFFGGTVNVKYVAITYAEDDSLDWTFGWVGKAQFVVVLQGGTESDHGIEADNDENNANLQPRSNPTIYNASFFGPRGLATQAGAPGALLRRGTAGTLRNVIWQNFNGIGIDVDGADSQSFAGTTLTVGSSFVFNNAGGVSNVDLGVLGDDNSTADPRLANPRGLTPDLSPRPGSPARGAGSFEPPPNDGFFDGVNFAGGVDPNAPWIWEGWLTFSDN